MKRCFLVLLFSLLLLNLLALDFYSQSSGDWSDPATWGMSGEVPGFGDDVIIQGGHTIDLVGITSLYINRLSITTSGPQAVLRGPYGMNCQLFVTRSINLEGSTGTACLIPGDYGSLSVELGGGMFFNGACLYQVSRTTFTALSYISGDRVAQLGIYGNGQVETVFDTSESVVRLEVVTSITLPGTITYGFENTLLDMRPEIGFTNCYFDGCTFFVRNFDSVNTLSNCHLYSCQANDTLFLDGPVAMMDNANIFANLILRSGGSLWGNYGTGSLVSINGNLQIQNGSLISPGEYGTLTVYLGGDIYVDGQCYPTELYFSGAGTVADPQELAQGPSGDIRCITTNSGSVLRLDTDFDFNPAVYDLYPGQFYLNGHTLAHAGIRYGQIHGTGTVRDCYLTSTVFHDPVTMFRVCLTDDGVVMNDDLTLIGGLTGTFGSVINLTVRGDLLINHGNIFPGDYGVLNLHLLGDITLTDDPLYPITFSPTNIYLEGTDGAQTINITGALINANLIAVDPLYVDLGSSLAFSPSLDKHVVSNPVVGTTFRLNGMTLANAILDGGDYVGGTLSEVTLFGVQGTDLTLTEDVILGDNDNVFYGVTNNYGRLQGSYGVASTLTLTGDIVNGGYIYPGSYGSLDAYCYGGISDIISIPITWQGSVHIRGIGSRSIRLSEPIPITVDAGADIDLIGENVLNSFTIEAGSSLTVSPLARLIIDETDGYYTGDLVMNGSFVNTRNLYLSDTSFHDLVIHPISLDGSAGTVTVLHDKSDPINLSQSTGEYWQINRAGEYVYVNGGIDLHYRGDMTSDLRLFYSLDGGNHWSLYSGETYNNPEQHIFTVTTIDIPTNIMLAISSVYNTWILGDFSPDDQMVTSLLPHFNWPDVYGAVAYRVEISNDDWQSVCYLGNVVAVSEYTAEWALAPGTTYRWKVYATSLYLGDICSADTYSFVTRPTMTCSLPANSAYLPGDPISFYMPSYIHNLLLGEAFILTPYSSANLHAQYSEGLLTLTPTPGWTGQETIDLQIADDFTVLNLSMNIVVLGDPTDLHLEIIYIEGSPNDSLNWSAVPGASYYAIFTADAPEGPWILCAWAAGTQINLSQLSGTKFYRVTARTGELPRTLNK